LIWINSAKVQAVSIRAEKGKGVAVTIHLPEWIVKITRNCAEILPSRPQYL